MWQPGCFGCGDRKHFRRETARKWQAKSARWSQPKQREQAVVTVKREDSTAVSHAVEENTSGSEPLSTQNRTPTHLVGGTPAVQAKLGEFDVLCVLDAGSMVSFVTEEFYTKNLKPTCGRAREDGQMLTLWAANGLEIPYLGYLELRIEVDGVKVP